HADDKADVVLLNDYRVFAIATIQRAPTHNLKLLFFKPLPADSCHEERCFTRKNTDHPDRGL
ncbi:MAG: hypothetical protein Q8J86_11420, partial [Desulfurivibrionaceae bacterium]|nr:hypothetical protein [Desulfurivibrionaceae bacterium]